MTIMSKHRTRATMSHSGRAAAHALTGRRSGTSRRKKTWRTMLGIGPKRRRRSKRGGELVLFIWLRGKQRQARGALLPYVVRSHAGTTKAGKGSVTQAKARKWARSNGNRCYVCNRPLTSEASIRAGAGPRCERKAGFR